MAASGSAWRGGWRKPAPTSPWSGATRQSRTPRSPNSSRCGVKAIAVTADVTDKARSPPWSRASASELGRIDILVNNAGINIRKPPHALELDEWDSVIKTNLTSAFLCSQAVHPAMKAAGGGKIINIGSMMSIFGASFAPAYAASKGGIVQFTRSCAVAWAADNIQANAILPGWIDTDLTKRAREQIDGLHDKRAGAHAGGALGRDRRLRGHRGVSVVERLGLRHRHRHPRRWRLLDHGLRSRKQPHAKKALPASAVLRYRRMHMLGAHPEADEPRGDALQPGHAR